MKKSSTITLVRHHVPSTEEGPQTPTATYLINRLLAAAFAHQFAHRCAAADEARYIRLVRGK